MDSRPVSGRALADIGNGSLRGTEARQRCVGALPMSGMELAARLHSNARLLLPPRESAPIIWQEEAFP